MHIMLLPRAHRQVLGQGSVVTLQRLLVPAEHQLSPATTDVGAPCVICHTAATHGCSGQRPFSAQKFSKMNDMCRMITFSLSLF